MIQLSFFHIIVSGEFFSYIPQHLKYLKERLFFFFFSLTKLLNKLTTILLKIIFVDLVPFHQSY